MRRILMPAYRKDEALGLIASAQEDLESDEDNDG
jgi:hypothetical protein